MPLAFRAAWSAVFACLSAITVHGQTWPQWRGPTRDSIVPAKQALPANLDSLSLAWRVELGPSYSGPIVSEKAVYATESVSEQSEVVVALDRGTGEQLWRSEWPGAMKVPFFAKRNGDWIRSTPALDGDSLYVAGMRDVLVCLDAATGSQRWRIDFAEKYGKPLPLFGFVPSPLVDGDALYVFAAHSLCKLNRRTGEVLWRALEQNAEDPERQGGFGSPVIATLAGKRQLVVPTRTELCGVDPDTGEVLWRQDVPNFRGCNIVTPTIYDGGVLTSSYQHKTWLFGVKHSPAGWAVDKRWEAKAQSYMSSPVIIGDYAYLHLANRRFACLDLRTGQEQWRSESFGEYASFAANSERILALDQRGELLVIAANPGRFELLERRKISDQETWGHLAVAGNQLFIRELNALSCYRW